MKIKLILWVILLFLQTVGAVFFYILEWLFWVPMWGWRLMMTCRKYFEEGCDGWRNPADVENGYSTPNIWHYWKEIFSKK